MSTQPTDDESPPPTPTAQRSEGPIPSAVLDRRTFLRGTAAAGGTALAAGTASADEDDGVEGDEIDEDLDEDFWLTTDGGNDPRDLSTGLLFAGSPAAWVLWQGVDLLGEYIWGPDQDDLSAAEDATLWMEARTAQQALFNFEAMLSNRLTDAQTVANIEARHGIASAWEDGESASDGYGRALERIRGYYEPLEANHWEIGVFTMVQLGWIAEAGTDESDTTEANWATASADYDGTHEHVFCRPTNEEWVADSDSDDYDGPVESADLHNGYGYQLSYYTKMRFFTSEGDSYEVPFSEFINSWDETAGEVVVQGDDHEWTTSGNFTTPNVPEIDEPGMRVFDTSEFVAHFDTIEEQSDEIVANYDTQFVEQLFAGMDDGTIDASQVRGVEGQARFMSGSTDATEDRYRLSLMQMLGLNQSDLSEIASMTISYDGYTAFGYEATDEDRYPRFDEHTEEIQTYAGQLFARTTPSSGFAAGGEYAAGSVLYNAADNGDLNAIYRDLGPDRDFDFTTDLTDVSVSPTDPETVAIKDGDDGLHMVDTAEDETLWTEDHTSTGQQGAWSPDGESFLLPADDGVVLYDAEDGSVIFDHTVGGSNYVDFSPDGSAFVSAGDSIAVYDIENNDPVERWSEPIDSSGPLGWGSDHIGFADQDHTRAYDPDDGTELWEYDSPSSYPDHLAIAPNDDVIFDGGGGFLIRLAAADGEELWSREVPDFVRGIVANYDGESYYSTDERIHKVDPDGDDLDTFDTSDIDGGNGLSLWPRPHQTDVDGVVTNALMFDAQSSDEIDIALGTFTLDEMTDSDGEQISPITDQTITDIEAQADRDIEDIVADIEEIEDADDITDLNDLNLILEAEELDGSEIQTDSTDWSAPDYDSMDNEEYGIQISEVGDYIIEETDLYSDDDDDGAWWPSVSGDFGDGFGGQLAGLAVIAVIVVSVVWSVVSDAIPFLGN